MNIAKQWKTALLAVALTGAGACSMVNVTHAASMSSMSDMKARNAQMLIQTLSEEKTEIAQLAAQRAALMKMGGATNMRIARMLGRWIEEHKAGGPTFMRLIRRNGGDPMEAKILKPPVLGDKTKMLHATMMDHMAAVEGSQMRYAMTNSAAIKAAMHMRGNLARKHMRQMKPYHNASNCPMCRDMMKMKHM